MKTFKKVIASVLAFAMVAAVSVGATVAYLQDDDSDVNVMTLGNVTIEQIEQEWSEDETKLVDFTQAKPLYPYVGVLGWENNTEADGAYRRFTMENVVDKYVTVKNTGKSDAYVRTIFAFEMGEYSTIAEFKYNVIGTSQNWVNGSEFKFPGTWVWNTEFVAQINGKNYMIWEAVHQDALSQNETTIPSLLQVYMNPNCGNEEVEKVDGNKNGTYEILVFSQAVQTAGFENAQTALDTAFGDITTTNHPWANGFTMVDSAEELVEAIKEGGLVTLTADVELNDAPLTITKDTVLDLNGFELTGTSTSSTTSNLIKVNAGAELTIEDGVVSFLATKPDLDWNPEGFPGYANNTISNTGKLTIKNATIENLTAKGGASYAIDCYQGSELFVEEGSVINGYDKIAIRMFANSKTLPTNVTINGGEVRGYRSVWIQLPGSDATATPVVNLTVNGGELISTDPTYTQVIYSYSYGNNFDNTVIELNGGTYYGDVALSGSGGQINGKETITIDKNNCTFYGAVYSYADADDEYIVDYDANKVYEAVASKAEVQDALKVAATAGAKEVVVDANGASIGNLNNGLSTSMVPAGSTVTLKNAAVSGSSYGNAVDGTVVFENCTFENASGAYSIHFDAGSGHVVFKNCVLNGWCSFGSAIKSVKMENCTIGGNGIYAMNRFYQDTTMTNCTIDCSNAPSDDSWVDGISAVDGAVVTLTNCNIIDAEWEVADGGKIVVNGTIVAE